MIRFMNSLFVCFPCNLTFELLKGWQDLQNCLFDRRKVFLRDLPNPPQIYTCVIVNQNIPESCHQPPGNLRMLGAKLLGNSLGCFTDNLKVPDDRILHHGVMQKGFSVLTYVLFDPVSTLQDMGQRKVRSRGPTARSCGTRGFVQQAAAQASAVLRRTLRLACVYSPYPNSFRLASIAASSFAASLVCWRSVAVSRCIFSANGSSSSSAASAPT